jgi:hypothetical protein
MNYFTYIDIYGGEFHLLINGSHKFKSIAGGILSLLTLGVFIWTVLIFADSFINRKNPMLRVQEGFFSNSTIISRSDFKDKIIIFEISKKITKYAALATSQVYNLSQPDFVLEEKAIPPCEKDYLKLIFAMNDTRLDEYSEYFNNFCLKLGDYDIITDDIGQFSNSDVSRLDIRLIDCKEEPELISKLKINTCDKNYNNTIEYTAVNLYMSKLSFRAELKDPFITKLSSFSQTYKLNEVSLSKLKLKTLKFFDDIGWITNSYVSKNEFNPYEFKPYYSAPTEGFKYPQFVISINITDDYTTYERSYEKIQDLLAKIGGFMKIILFILNLVNTLISKYLLETQLIDKIFYNKIECPVKSIKIMSDSNVPVINNIYSYKSSILNINLR